MKTGNFKIKRLAGAVSSCLMAVLFVSANTNSCMVIHQPKAPKTLSKFSKIK